MNLNDDIVNRWFLGTIGFGLLTILVGIFNDSDKLFGLCVIIYFTMMIKFKLVLIKDSQNECK